MLNVTLIGNLGTDPAVGATQNGTSIATLRVAINQSRIDANTGERIESAEWFRVRAMGRLVDLAQRLTQGSRVLVIGRLEIGHYQSSEGDPRISYDIWANELVPLNPRSEYGASQSRDTDQHRPAQPPTPPPGPGGRQDSDLSHPTAGSRTRRSDEDERSLPW